ncbi:MAG: aminotransferase class IV [Nitrospinota bacterium]
MPYSHYIIDGKLLKAESPANSPFAISPNDRSFMLGDGLFETVKVLHGKAVWLEDHLERIESSASAFGIAFTQKKKIPALCDELIGKNAITDGFLRITVSRGAAATGRFSDMPGESALVIIGTNIEPDKKPAKAAFAPWPVNENDPAVFHKTTSRFSLVEAFRRAKTEGLDEFVFVNTKDEIAEGIFSNVFWLKGGTIFTPSEECGILPGIARAKVMERANDTGINVLSGRFSRKDIIDADEIFFTNSVIGVRPCAEFEGRGLKPGKIAPKIAQELF